MEHISTQETLAPDYYILFTFLLGTLLTQVIFQQLWYTITAKKHAALPGPLGFPVLGMLLSPILIQRNIPLILLSFIRLPSLYDDPKPRTNSRLLGEASWFIIQTMARKPAICYFIG
jgi:hypothetical protein